MDYFIFPPFFGVIAHRSMLANLFLLCAFALISVFGNSTPNSATSYVNDTYFLHRSADNSLQVSRLDNLAGSTHVATIVANMSYLELGWDFVQVAPAPWLLLQSDDDAYYLTGYLEGYVTFDRMDQILIANNLSATTPEKAKKWVLEHIDYMNATSQARSEEPFWLQVKLLLAMLRGLTDGYRAANLDTGSLRPAYTFYDIFLLNFGNDLGDVLTATNMTDPNMTSLNVDRERRSSVQHCSALVKVTADDIYFSHVTWGGYNTMVRQYKTYVMGTTVSFSSVAGTIASGDDWYITSNNLAVQETTNEFPDNNSLYLLIKPNSVSEFMRTMVANFLAKTGPEWVGYFAVNHSGTYCNQYMVLDYNLYRPGQQLSELPTDLLWVTEEIPGLVRSADVTDYLRNFSYWASYNIPYFKDIYTISGFGILEEQIGSYFSYDDYARATIFRRNQSQIVDLPSMERMMRYNNWETDPLAIIPNCSVCAPQNSPWQTIAARGDLVPGDAVLPVNEVYQGYLSNGAQGAIDAKIASYSMLKNSLQGRVICGPTTDQQPPFSWTQYPSLKPPGSPEVFDFGWVNFNAVDLFPPAPQSSDDKSSDVIIGVCIGVPLAALVVALVVRTVTSRSRTIQAGAEYKPLV